MDYKAFGKLTAACRKEAIPLLCFNAFQARVKGNGTSTTSILKDVKILFKTLYVPQMLCIHFPHHVSIIFIVGHPFWPTFLSIFLFCGFGHKVSFSPVQTHGGQPSSVPVGPTVPLPYMYTRSGYVNFDMWVSISPIFTVGFIRPWLVFRANLEVKRKTPLAVCKPTLRVPLLGTAYLQGSSLFC